MIVWTLTDDRIGSNNQSITVSEKLSRYYVIKKIVYNSFIKLPNFIRGSSLIGVNKEASDNIKTELPDIIVCAGRRLSSVALNIKKRSGGRTFIVNIMNPDISFNRFDLIILPKHDNTSKRLISKGNVFETNGALNRINTQRIKTEVEKWKDFFKDYKKPLISLIIGGDTKNYKFDPKEFGIMISNLSNIVNKLSGTLLITTSRRTSSECIMQIRQKINCDYYLYDWKWENDARNLMKNPLGNPYFAFLGLSDFIIVTGDSMSMISEACSTGKPTYIYMPRNSISKKHLRFCSEMIKENYTKEFDKNTVGLEKYTYTPLNELDRVVNFIYKKLEEKK